MRTAIATVFLLASCFGSIGAAHAQLLDNLKGAAGMGNSSGSGGGLGGMSMPSVGSASNGNIAGVLGYCVRNNYVGGSGASSVQNNLMGKLGGNTASSPEFTSGENGTLQTGNGQSMNLGGGGLKAQLTQKVCDQVLKHAKSLI
jgi:hypothetical protein